MKIGTMHALAAILALGAMACESETGSTGTNGGGLKTTAVDAAAQANAAVGTLSDDFATQMGFLSESKAMEGLEGDCADVAEPIGPGTDQPPPSDCGEPVEPEEMAKDFQTWLKDHLLNPDFANPALSTETEAVFCMKAEQMCEEETESGKTVNQECVAGFAAAPLCIGLTKTGDQTMTGRVLIGKAPIVPATFTLSPTSFSAKVDLPKAREAADTVAKAHGEALPEEFPTIVEGVIGGDMAKQSDGSYALSLSIAQAMRISAWAKTDKRHYDIKLGTAAKALDLTVKGEKTMFGGAHLGTVDVVMAMDLLFGGASCSETEYRDAPIPEPGVPMPDPGKQPPPECEEPPAKVGNFLLSLAGPAVAVNYAMSADNKTETVKLTGLTLGNDTARLRFDDYAKVTEIATLDLNKSAGRKVDIEVVAGEGDPIFSVTNLLDVELGHWMAAIAPQIEDLPAMFLQGISRIALGGAAKPTLQLMDGGDTASPEPVNPGDPMPPEPEPQGPQTLLKVVAGTLDLTATGLKDIADVAIKLATGQCLVEKQEGEGGEGEGEKHLFSAFEAGACE